MIAPRWLLLRLQAVLAAGLATAAPCLAAGGTPLEACKALWGQLQTAVKQGDLKAAGKARTDLMEEPGCGDQRSKADEVMLGLHRDRAVRLEKEGASPAERLAALNAAIRHGNQWNTWDIHAKIGDLERRIKGAGGEPDYAGISRAYDLAVRAIDKAPDSAKPAATEIRRLMALAYQFEAISPTLVRRRGLFTRTARQLNAERAPLSVQFVYDRAQMTDLGREYAEQILGVLEADGMPPIHLVGHTDPVGSDQYNDDLSARRANAIRDFLIAAGYPRDRITTEGRGKRDVAKLQIEDEAEFTRDQVHQMLRRVELVWK